MRFMIIVKANVASEAGIMPAPEMFEAMGRFNEELIAAGVLLTAEGLHPSSKGARITRQGGKFTVEDGPFPGTRDLIAGFWVINARSRDEALDWVRRIPFEDGETIELRRVFEAADFAEIVPEDAIAREQAWRDANQQPITN